MFKIKTKPPISVRNMKLQYFRRNSKNSFENYSFVLQEKIYMQLYTVKKI